MSLRRTSSSSEDTPTARCISRYSSVAQGIAAPRRAAREQASGTRRRDAPCAEASRGAVTHGRPVLGGVRSHPCVGTGDVRFRGSLQRRGVRLIGRRLKVGQTRKGDKRRGRTFRGDTWNTKQRGIDRPDGVFCEASKIHRMRLRRDLTRKIRRSAPGISGSSS